MDVHQEDLHTNLPVGGAQLEVLGRVWGRKTKGKECSEWVSKVIHKTHFRGKPKKQAALRALVAKDKNSSRAQLFSLECWLTALLERGAEMGLSSEAGT